MNQPSTSWIASCLAPAGEGSLGGPGIAMPEPTADEVAAAAAEMASSFDQQVGYSGVPP